MKEQTDLGFVFSLWLLRFFPLGKSQTLINIALENCNLWLQQSTINFNYVTYKSTKNYSAHLWSAYTCQILFQGPIHLILLKIPWGRYPGSINVDSEPCQSQTTLQRSNNQDSTELWSTIISLGPESVLLTTELWSNGKCSLCSIEQQGGSDLCFVTSQASIFTIYSSKDHKNITRISSVLCNIDLGHLLQTWVLPEALRHIFRKVGDGKGKSSVKLVEERGHSQGNNKTVWPMLSTDGTWTPSKPADGLRKLLEIFKLFH